MILYAYPPHDSYFLEFKGWNADMSEKVWQRTMDDNLDDEGRALEIAAWYAAKGHAVRVIKTRTTCEAIETLEGSNDPQ
jgi:hypothetical protein